MKISRNQSTKEFSMRKYWLWEEEEEEVEEEEEEEEEGGEEDPFNSVLRANLLEEILCNWMMEAEVAENTFKHFSRRGRKYYCRLGGCYGGRICSKCWTFYSYWHNKTKMI